MSNPKESREISSVPSSFTLLEAGASGAGLAGASPSDSGALMSNPNESREISSVPSLDGAASDAGVESEKSTPKELRSTSSLPGREEAGDSSAAGVAVSSNDRSMSKGPSSPKAGASETTVEVPAASESALKSLLIVLSS